MKRNNFCVFQTGFYYTGVCAQVCVHVCAQRSRLRAIIMTKTERKKPGNRGSQREDSPKI